LAEPGGLLSETRVACDGLDGLGAAGPAYAMSVRIIAKGNSVSDGA
jgi:hypothetical protein